MATQTLSQPVESNLLRFSLRLDSMVVALSGVLFIAAARPIVDFLGVGAPWMFISMGFIHFAYTVYLWWLSARQPISDVLALGAVLVNVVWVVASAVILFTGWLPLTNAGWWAVAIVADLVGLIAGLQFYGWWKQR